MARQKKSIFNITRTGPKMR